MPLEILVMIMELIPDAMTPSTMASFRRAWHVDVQDMTMLMPISQTCRQLRTVALGCPSLWTSVAYWPPSLNQIFAERSQGLPLKAFLSGTTYVENSMLINIVEELLSRVQELDIGDLERWSIPDDFFSHPSPDLETLSVHYQESTDDEVHGKYLVELPLTPEHAPRLKRLYLGACNLASLDILSSLTHLALHVIIIPRVHELIMSILPACHSLESLHLEEVEDQSDLSLPANDYRRLPTPRGPISPGFHRLRKVALLCMFNRLASLVLSSVLADQHPLTVQLHTIYPDSSEPTVHQHRILESPSRVVIGRYPQPHRWKTNIPLTWGLTAIGSQRTLRATGDTMEEVTGMLHEGGPTTLAEVRELWLADVSPAPCEGSDPLPTPDADSLRALIQGMPALEAVVIINQFQASWTRAPPSLRLLPNAHDEAASQSAPHPKTLRIAYGYGRHVLNLWSERPDPTPVVPPLDFTSILEELASGAYDYLQHLVLEIPPRVEIDSGDVERLRAHFETVQVRVVSETPTVVLPAYCDEAAAWPSDDPWPYRLW